jgi:hypothetical protein
VCCRPTNWIEKLNQQVANQIDRAYWTREKRNWPVDLIGGHRHPSKSPKLTIDPKLRQAIIDTELTSQALTGDDIHLEYYDDGYPKLPDASEPFGALRRVADH